MFGEPQAQARMPRTGDVLSERYYVSQLIGQGGFSAVYEGSDMKAGGVVALKVLRPGAGSDLQLPERFRQEAELNRQLQHPNTIRVLDCGVTEHGCLFTVLEFLNGTALDEVVTEHGPLDEQRVIHILDQVLRSVGEAHRKGIVHRDLKPSNIMLVPTASDPDFVKVLDFGIAKALSPDGGQVRTQTGFVVCTPTYASPEALRGSGVVAASDVYSIGLIGAELLTGQEIVSGSAEAEIIAKQVSPNPVPIPGKIATTPLGEILCRATEKSVGKRYPEAHAMLSDLLRLGRQADGPVPGPQVSHPAPQATVEYSVPQATVQYSAPQAAVPYAQPPQPAPQTLVEAQETVPIVPPPQGAGDPEAVTFPYQPTERSTFVGQPGTGEEATMVLQMDPPAKRSRGLIFLFLFLLLCVGGGLAVYFFTLDDAPDAERTADVVEPEPDPEPEPEPEPEPVEPVEVTARDILETRLALADWDTGSWVYEAQLAVAPQRSVDASGAIRIEALPDADEEGIRVALLYESAQASQDALALLNNAFRSGGIDESERETLVGQLVGVVGQLVSTLVDLDNCGAAERRLDQALRDAEVWGVSNMVGTALEVARADIQACRDRTAVASAAWDPQAYVDAVHLADVLCERAEEEENLDTSRNLRFRCVHQRQTAIAMLESALSTEGIPAERIPRAREELARLNQEVFLTLLDLDLTVAAQAELEQTLERTSLLSAGDAAALTQFKEQLNAETLRAAAASLWDREQFTSLTNRGSELYQSAKTHEPDEGPALYSARVRINTEPRRAHVYLNGRDLGRTPFDEVIESTDPSVVLSIRKNEYATQRVRISLTGGAVRESLTLETEHPFGNTGLIE